MDQIKAVMLEEHTETVEQTYDIYLLPPGEDPESCQSYLRMRNKDGKYNLMFEVCPFRNSTQGIHRQSLQNSPSYHVALLTHFSSQHIAE